MLSASLQLHANQAGLVTGHDFSRAEKRPQTLWALAPAGLATTSPPFRANDSFHENKIDIHLRRNPHHRRTIEVDQMQRVRHLPGPHKKGVPPTPPPKFAIIHSDLAEDYAILRRKHPSHRGHRAPLQTQPIHILRKSRKHLCQFSQLFHVEQFRGVEQRRLPRKLTPNRPWPAKNCSTWNNLDWPSRQWLRVARLRLFHVEQFEVT
jgi:hypothetical protein